MSQFDQFEPSMKYCDNAVNSHPLPVTFDKRFVFKMIQVSSLYFRQCFKIDLVMTSGSLSTVLQNVLTDFSRILPSQPTSNILDWNRNNLRCCKYHMNVDRSTTFYPPSLRLCSFLPSWTRRNRLWCLYTLSLWTQWLYLSCNLRKQVCFQVTYWHIDLHGEGGAARAQRSKIEHRIWVVVITWLCNCMWGKHYHNTCKIKNIICMCNSIHARKASTKRIKAICLQ